MPELTTPSAGPTTGVAAGGTLADHPGVGLDDFAVPTGREEAWRFTPIDRLAGLQDGTDLAFDGVVTLSADLAPEVELVTLAADDPRVPQPLWPIDRPSALALARAPEVTVVTVPAGVVTERPSVVTLRGEGGTSAGRTVIDAHRDSQAVVVLDHVGQTKRTDQVEIKVADGASLTVVSLQDWDVDAVHLSHQHAVLGRDAYLRSVVVTFGGDLVRVVPTVEYTAPGANAELYGLYFADAGQHLEHRLLVDHAVPHCRSRVTYKGALQGEDAHTVWVGDVVIRHAALGTDTYEINRNLVLTDGARADSVPNLEIETGEVVGAGHASATGRFDDEQLFYLQSRGIPEDLARRLVVRGFFADVLQHIGVPEIATRLMAKLESELGA